MKISLPLTALAINFMRALAHILESSEDFFEDFCYHSVAVLWLLRYPRHPATGETDLVPNYKIR